MTKLVNRAKMTTATTGTGAITLGSAVDGYQTFAAAGVADGDVVRYVIEDGDNWEIGTGTYTASGTSLSRTVLESSNADAEISLTGEATVFVGAAAEDVQQPPSEGAFVDGDKTKLDSVETGADVTDTTNVTAAGALMDSEVENLAQVKSFDSADYATAAQGGLADTAVQPGDNISTLTNDAGYINSVPVTELVGTVTNDGTLDLSTGTVFEYTPTENTTFVFDNPPASGTAQRFTLNITGVAIAPGFVLGNASYDSVSFNVSSQDTKNYDLTFNNDSTKMYVVGRDNDRIFQYSLSTPRDISTASYDSVSVNVGALDSQPFAVSFNSDGTKMYYVGGNFGIFQYSLSTAFDLNTASYDSVSFNTDFQDNAPQDISFNTDGTKMFIYGGNSAQVYQYNLSTAFNLSTASYSGISFNVGSQSLYNRNLSFSNDGTKMFIMAWNTGVIYQYNLSTAFNLSTASYSGISFDATSPFGGSSSDGMAFSHDGIKMYLVDDSVIYQYSTQGTSVPVTFAYPPSVDFPGGTAPDAPVDGETDTLEFITLDGGTTYYGRQTGNNYS